MASKNLKIGKGKGKSGKLDKYIDYGIACSMRVSDDHLLEEIVRALPGLSSGSVFHKSVPKVKQKAERKGKAVKGKGKCKSTGKSGRVSGK